MKSIFLKISFILLFLILGLQNQSFAQQATQQQKESVQAELKKFKAGWSGQIPYESTFGIIKLCNLLDLDYPGLEKVKAAFNQKDWDKAGIELLYYFKNVRKFDTPPAIKSLSAAEIEASENALNHYFRGNGNAHPPVFRGANIDWVSPGVYDGKEITDGEWPLQFNRLGWWSALAKAYVFTNDVRYFDEWRYELVDYANKFLPNMKQQAPYFIHRGMETYGRCILHRTVIPYFIKSPDFDLATLQYYLMSFYLQAEHIRTVYSEDGNHLLGELNAVFSNGAFYPEFKNSKVWIDEAAARIPERMFADIYPDGMNKELIFSYHTMYLDLFLKSYDLFKKYGYDKQLPEEYLARLLKMVEIYAYHIFPDNTTSLFGDSWKKKDASRTVVNFLSQFAPDYPYLEFIKTRGAKGTPLPKASIAYPVSGFYFFRSDWTPNAVFMSMKNNYLNAWHSQFDNGNFEFYALGRNFMNDSGCYIYGSDDAEDIKARSWFKSSYAHQTLTLNNKDMKVAGKHIFWKDTDRLTALVNENASYDSLVHRRTTLFIDKKYFLIYDEAIGDAAGDVRTHFQLVPCNYDVDKKTNTIRTRFEDGANLIVKNFKTTQSANYKKEEGWISNDILKKDERPAWSFGITKTKGQKEVFFLTALVPYLQDQTIKQIDATVRKSKSDVYFKFSVDSIKYQIRLNTELGIAELTKE